MLLVHTSSHTLAQHTKRLVFLFLCVPFTIGGQVPITAPLPETHIRVRKSAAPLDMVQLWRAAQGGEAGAFPPTDVVLAIGGVEVAVHRCVLAARGGGLFSALLADEARTGLAVDGELCCCSCRCVFGGAACCRHHCAFHPSLSRACARSVLPALAIEIGTMCFSSRVKTSARRARRVGL